MAIKTDAELTAAANVIGAETAVGGNTKERVASMLIDIIDSKPNNPLRAGYDVSLTGAFPESGGSGAAGAILTGNMFPVIVAGNINLGNGNELIPVGSILFALANSPGQDATKWRVI